MLQVWVTFEIHNPLGAVFLHVDLLEEESRQPSPDSVMQIAQSFTEIKMHLARLDDLGQDYLYPSQDESAAFTLTGVRVSASSLCSPARAMAWIVLLRSYAKILQNVRTPIAMQGQAIFCYNTWQAPQT